MLDNCAIQRAKKVVKYMKRLRIAPIFNVPYSPELAAHETVINLVKHYYQKFRLEELELNMCMPIEITLEVTLNKVSQEHISKIRKIELKRWDCKSVKEAISIGQTT